MTVTCIRHSKRLTSKQNQWYIFSIRYDLWGLVISLSRITKTKFIFSLRQTWPYRTRIQTVFSMLLSDRDVPKSGIIKRKKTLFIKNTNGHHWKIKFFLIYQKSFLNVISLDLKRLISYKVYNQTQTQFAVSIYPGTLEVWFVHMYRITLWLERFSSLLLTISSHSTFGLGSLNIPSTHSSSITFIKKEFHQKKTIF